MKIKKELDALKRVCEALQSKVTNVEEQIERRNESFDDRSDSWQDSDRGNDYAQGTDLLQEQLDEFIQNVDELEAIIGEFENLCD